MVDAGKTGNFTRFFNHSCDPNCWVQPLLAEHHDRSLIKNCLFARTNIKPETHLT